MLGDATGMKPKTKFERLKYNSGHAATVWDTMGNTIEGFIDLRGSYDTENGIYLRQSQTDYTFIGKALIREIHIEKERT